MSLKIIFLILKLKFHFFCAIGLSDSFKMICSNFTNHRVVKNLKFYRCLYFVLCIVFSGAYSNCILENLVRIYQTGHKQWNQNLYEVFNFYKSTILNGKTNKQFFIISKSSNYDFLVYLVKAIIYI